MVKVGVAMMILAFCILMGALAFPDVLTPLTPLYCHSGETLIRSTFTFSIPGETSSTFYYHCADAEGVETRDVSSQVTWSILGVFFAFEFGGIGVLTFGGRRKHRDDDLTDYERTSHIPKRLQPSRQQGTLAERLRELQEARSQGLITETEYQTLRQQALEKDA